MERINVVCFFIGETDVKNTVNEKGVGMTLSLIKKNKEAAIDEEVSFSIGQRILFTDSCLFGIRYFRIVPENILMLYGNFIISVDFYKIRNDGIEIYGDFCYELIHSSLSAYNSWTRILKKICKNNEMGLCKINCDHTTDLLIWHNAASRNKKLIETCLHELI